MRTKSLWLSALFITILAVLGNTTAFAQRDRIEGIWWNAEKSAKIQIYKAVDGKFWGKIVWLKEPLRNGKPKTDIENPKKNLRNTPLLGYPVLKAMVKDGEDTYDDGSIYDPKNGKTYDCKITWRNANELGLRGYVGISMIGRTSTWTRAN